MQLKNVMNVLLVILSLFSGVIIAHYDKKGLTFIECGIRPRERGSRSYGPLPHPHPNSDDNLQLTDANSAYASFTHPHMPIQEGTSQNWAGYAAVTNLAHPKAGKVSAVFGSWTVPTLSASSDDTYCSLWVGIDGYSSRTVEQIGTEHDWYNGQQHDYAWFEMYPRYSYEIVSFPVNPGDVINGLVMYQGNGVFVLTIVNQTRAVYTTIPTSYTTSRTAKRSSAEWIAEAPYSGGILPLSHFGTVNFTNCTAVINNIYGPINNSFWAYDALRMTTAAGGAKATPSALTSNGQAFSVAWAHE